MFLTIDTTIHGTRYIGVLSGTPVLDITGSGSRLQIYPREYKQFLAVLIAGEKVFVSFGESPISATSNSLEEAVASGELSKAGRLLVINDLLGALTDYENSQRPPFGKEIE